ncbi:unnamed protein product [Caenorhabditis bovis]|uniref:CRIB domain-containing protein n=1 Tax=Caenorhabditis bovis TaxID=2654633 RepID=A0A8S1EFE5_9PELO|nr:unnamed protein product [Caenorhabditis bovis]
MSHDFALLPPKKSSKFLAKNMISMPNNFRHLAHMEKEDAWTVLNGNGNEGNHEYLRPSSSNGGTLSRQLDRSATREIPEIGSIRNYENLHTSHAYQNVAVKKSPKSYRAPSPPPRISKPTLNSNVDEQITETIIFRANPRPATMIENEPQPTIATPERIEAPKPNSIVLERPEFLLCFGLDDPIPVQKNPTPLHSFSPLHRPVTSQTETPILTSHSTHQTTYETPSRMGTIRSTSRQGTEILEDLDAWLDEIDEIDRKKIEEMETDEEGYPSTLTDKDFMRKLVKKYSLPIKPETIKIRHGKGRAPSIPRLENSSSENVVFRPVSEPLPPQFEAPVPPTTANQNLSRNMMDLRAIDSEDDGTIPKNLAKFISSRAHRLSDYQEPGLDRLTISSGFTDVSTTSSIPYSSNSESIHDEDVNETDKPIPLPRTKTLRFTRSVINRSLHQINTNIIISHDNWYLNDEK